MSLGSGSSTDTETKEIVTDSDTEADAQEVAASSSETTAGNATDITIEEQVLFEKDGLKLPQPNM